MKNLYTLIFVLILNVFSSFGQYKVDYDSRSNFYLGLNLGGTYHSHTEVDVNRLYRGGAGFTFGYSFGMKPDNRFSLDLQLRYLLAAFRGQSESKYQLGNTANDILNNNTILTPVTDYESAYNYYVPNFHSWVNDWSLELKLNTNRLRQNTGWNFFILGGIGYNRYHTEIDFYDFDNSGSVKPEAELFEKGQFISDYETSIVNKHDWMPSFGAGIERQITPNAAFTLMGRMTWTRNNDFDGLAKTHNGNVSEVNDVYHYASAGIKFYLRGRKNHYVEEEEPVIVNPPVTGRNIPVVKFTDPKTSPITVSSDTYKLSAVVHYVNGKSNITFSQNGIVSQGFLYNDNSDIFESTVKLIVGNNIFKIKGVNQFGQAEDETIIIYKKEDKRFPIVDIINPGTNPITVSVANFSFSADVLNVSGKQDVQFYINAVQSQNFSFNVNAHLLNAPLTLVPGKNVITVVGTNPNGSDSESTTIIYEPIQTGNPPVVTFINPANSPITINSNIYQVNAIVNHVQNKNDVAVKINGNTINNFNFNSSTGATNFVANLVLGINKVDIIAVNTFGQGSASTTIVYEVIQIVQPPVVTISSPSSNGTVFSVPNAPIVGKALYVNSKNNVTVKINNVSTTNFNFNVATKVVSFNAPLVTGNNSIEIIGVNQDGVDNAIVSVVYKQPVVKTPPVVNITNPSFDNKVFTSANTTLNATVLNVVSKNQINVIVNGSSTNNYSFNSSNKQLSLPLVLISGNNTIQITGTNNDGVDSKTRIIKYKKAVVLNPPTVNYISPILNPTTVLSNSYTVKAVTTNIVTKSQVVVKHNGVSISQGSFSFGSALMTYNATLTVGANVIETIVTNTSGTDSKTTVINFEEPNNPCIAPTVGYVAPQPNATVNSAAQNIEAQINNHIPGTNVKLKLNGVNQGLMSFNASTQIANKNVVLVSGTNTLEIEVSNVCGSNKSTFILYYQTVTPPCLSPVVSLINNQTQVTNLNYSLNGLITNMSSSTGVVLKVNGQSKTFNFTPSTGVFNAQFNLVNGNNVIILTATKSCGDDSKTIQVFANNCVQPKLSAVTPNNLIVSTSNSSYSLLIGAVGVLNVQDINVKLNGASKTFNYNSITKQITINVSGLNIGVNNVLVEIDNLCGTDKLNYSITRIPCVKPVIVVKSTATSVNTLSYNYSAIVTGVNSKSDITLKVNGSSRIFTYQPSNGLVTANLVLVLGNNKIEINATNNCGVTTKILNVNATNCITPSLSMVSPNSLIQTTQNQSINIIVNSVGINSKANVNVSNNGTAIPFSFNSLNNQISVNVKSLKIGLNTITITISNLCGAKSLSYVVTRKPCVKPIVTLKSNSQTINGLSFNYSALVSGVTSKSGIKLLLNGKSISFGYNASSKLVSANLTLKQGKNIIELSATNQCGLNTKSITVTALNCVSPQIKLIKPTVTNVQTFTNSYSLSMALVGVTSQKQIQVQLNGSKINFAYNGATKLLSVNAIGLKIGANSLKVVVTNQCGTANKVFNITRKVCDKPVIKITSSTGTVSGLTYQLSTLVTGMNSSKGMTLLVNGQKQTFNFNTNTKVLTANLNLVVGSNSIKLTAINSCGSVTKSIVLNAVNCTAPIVKVGYPTSLNVTTSNSVFVLSAKAFNVTTADITVTNNGTIIPFTYNASLKQVTVSVTNMSSGANNIKISASNACGNASITYVIQYNGTGGSKSAAPGSNSKGTNKKRN